MIRLSAAALLVFSSPVFAQSSISLDDFDLGPSNPVAPSVKETPTMERCLKQPELCQDGAFSSDVKFSVDDVLNFYIEDRGAAEDGSAVQTDASFVDDIASDVDTSEPLPSIDLNVLFDSNSDAIRSDQYEQLFELAGVLRDGDFDRYKLLFMGHTDAKGSAAYNMDLSLRRARSVANLVASAAGVPADRIGSIGLGFSRLANETNPLADENRRVQLLLVPLK